MKNKTKKIVGLACAILLIVLVQAIGITYAKYLTVEKGSGSAEVAKWGFEIVKNGTQTKTINLADTVSSSSLVDGKIAPGTKGTIVLTIDASQSEVDMDYSLSFENEQNKPNNIIFTYGSTQYKSLSEIKSIFGSIEHDSETKTRDIVIFWTWGYETGSTNDEKAANDILDTQDASAISQYKFDIIATGTQSR